MAEKHAHIPGVDAVYGAAIEAAEAAEAAQEIALRRYADSKAPWPSACAAKAKAVGEALASAAKAVREAASDLEKTVAEADRDERSRWARKRRAEIDAEYRAALAAEGLE